MSSDKTMASADAGQGVQVQAKQPPGRVRKELLQFAKSLLVTHKLPLGVVLSILIFPKLLIVVIPLILIWTIGEFIAPKLPLSVRLRAQKLVPESWAQSAWYFELMEGLNQMRPFILVSMYIFCAPMAVAWIFGHWVASIFRSNDESSGPVVAIGEVDRLSFRQNVRKQAEEGEANFFHSPAFSVTCLTVFATGIPAAVTYLVYQLLGIDAILGFPSREPEFKNVFIIIGLYIYSVGCCLTLLFFRNWFTFPTNFLGDESVIELTAKGIRRNVKSWYSRVMTFNAPGAGRDYMQWQEVKSIGYEAPNAIRLSPLPTTALPADSLIYKVLNRGAQLIDGVTQRSESSERIFFSTENAGIPASILTVNLSDLDGSDRARLFYGIRKWAPHVVIDPRVQQKMLGSSVLQAPRYTQMWFELLTDKMPRKRSGSLCPDETLRDGKITVLSRLSSGGQANTYVAQLQSGEEVVLKEFILSAADAVGALVESAGEFETESTLLSELRHERIIKMLDFFAEDRRLYIVLEKAPGCSLREFVKQHGPLSERQTIELTLQIAEVLEYLHGLSPPVVHRDIAPDNLIFDGHANIKVIDFSLAAAHKSRRTTSTMGKHSYTPPEQLREQPCPASDIYALGATMYFLLSGCDPKPITSSEIRSKRADVSAELDSIIHRATQLDVDKRYSEVGWMKLELESLLAANKPAAEAVV